MQAYRGGAWPLRGHGQGFVRRVCAAVAAVGFGGRAAWHQAGGNCEQPSQKYESLMRDSDKERLAVTRELPIPFRSSWLPIRSCWFQITVIGEHAYRCLAHGHRDSRISASRGGKRLSLHICAFPFRLVARSRNRCPFLLQVRWLLNDMTFGFTNAP